jgi:hypothetical protein
MIQIINGLRYNTETAQLVASDNYWDGQNFDRRGRNTYLYKTLKGNYFLHHTTRWQGEIDSIVAVTKEDAKSYYENLVEHEMTYEEAFNEVPFDA